MRQAIQKNKMILVFQRTGERRYRVEARRGAFPDLVMDPAPGYDARMPHDLMHLVVEAQLGLTQGIFGQLAAGGNAGTFYVPHSDGNTRALSRTRNHVKTRGKKLLRAGRDDCMRSEQAAHICWQVWSAGPQPSNANAPDLPGLNSRTLNRICDHLDALSSQWSSLAVGESLSVRWPDLKTEILKQSV